jgi:hypothetical protein
MALINGFKDLKRYKTRLWNSSATAKIACENPKNTEMIVISNTEINTKNLREFGFWCIEVDESEPNLNRITLKIFKRLR